MMNRLLNAARTQSRRSSQDIVSSRVGSITSFDPNTWTARVQLQPDDTLTGWLPIDSPWVGNGWGLFAAANIGDMVDVEYINGDINGGTIVARFWNQVSKPLPVASGELWIVHNNGSYFKLTNDGKVQFSDAHGASIVLDGSGNIDSAATTWTHNGNVNITGTVDITGNANVSETLTATTDVVGGGVSLKNHLTTEVMAGTALSGPPQA